MKKECEIVQDLLFGYNDETLRKSSKELVEKHLANCEECQDALKDIQEDTPKEEKNENAKNRRSRKAQNKSPDMQMNIFDEEEIPEKYLDIYLSLEKPLSREEIAQKINKNIRQVNELLTMMEIEGLIEQTVGNMFKRII